MSTITRRLTAISQAHQLAGHRTPTYDERVRTVLEGHQATATAVQVILLSAHRVLDGDVQIPEGRIARHLDRAPDEWISLL